MTSPPLDVVLVEPYFAGSHRAWAEGYVRHSRHHVRLVTHEGNFWRWRLRGASLTLAHAVSASVAERGRPDVVLVSDMVNLAAFLGFTRRTLGDVPVALYLHENQLLYPPPPPRRSRSGRRNVGDPEEAALVNWISLAAADAIFVNSEFHRDALLAELPRLLNRAPDHAHAASLSSVVEGVSVLSVGVELDGLICSVRPPPDHHDPLILWNQRWEHDKDPETFFDALLALADEGVAFRLALAGENVRTDPQEFDQACRRLGDRIVHVGHLPDADYRRFLLRSDVVVSTALHEFFGIAIVEACAAGAVPLLPDRLSYPEIIPSEYHPAVLYADGDLRDRLRVLLADVDAGRGRVAGLRESMRAYDWRTLAPLYDHHLRNLAGEYRRAP